jgi:RNA polymerase sigma-70 factor, ECF subfamily
LITGPRAIGHTKIVADASTRSNAPPAGVAEFRTVAPDFDTVYEQHFPFVWRSVRRLGVPAAAVDDVVQDVFIVVHRRLSSFEGRSTFRSWLYAIVARVVRDFRRSLRRKPGQLGGDARADADPESLANPTSMASRNDAANAEATRLLHTILSELRDDRREVFVLSELEEMTSVEIAAALGQNVNTVYSRLRAARRDFEHAALRHRARLLRRVP